jgi:hypothetical protein
VPRTRGERGARRAFEQNAPQTPHSSGQGGSMFYVRERRSSNSRERLTRAIQRVSQQHEPACGQRLCSFDEALKTARRSSELTSSSFHDPTDDCQFCYNKNSARHSRQRTSSSVTTLSRFETADSRATNCKPHPLRRLDAPRHEGVVTALAEKIAEIAYRISSAKRCSYKTYEWAEKPTKQIWATRGYGAF